MDTLTLRPYLEDADLASIADLINTCEAVDQLDSGTSVAELRLGFNRPSFVPERDIRLWESADRTLIGYAELAVADAETDQLVTLWYKVHPSQRGKGLEAEILAWAEAQTRKISLERGIPGKLHVPARSTQTDKIALLSNSGFNVVRSFYRMERSLHDPIPEPQFPVGFSLRSLRGDEEVEAWVELFNQSFIDHWNHHDLTVEDCRYWLNLPHYRADLDLVAVAPDGALAAFCYSEIDPLQNDRTGRQEGGVHLLGSRRPYRRLGLGRAMLLSGLHRLQAAGMDVARLGVDADNPSGAKRLYESVGFYPLFNNRVFEKVGF